MKSKPIPVNVPERLFYEQSTGILTWKHRLSGPKEWNTRWAGREAGERRPDGVYVVLNWVRYKASRLIMACMGVSIPDGMQVDHRNGDPLDNRWSNLRLATHAQNMRNCKSRGAYPKGVHFDTQTGKFRAQIKYGGKNHPLGRFVTVEAAAEAYRVEAKRVFGEYACTDRAVGAE